MKSVVQVSSAHQSGKRGDQARLAKMPTDQFMLEFEREALPPAPRSIARTLFELFRPVAHPEIQNGKLHRVYLNLEREYDTRKTSEVEALKELAYAAMLNELRAGRWIPGELPMTTVTLYRSLRTSWNLALFYRTGLQGAWTHVQTKRPSNRRTSRTGRNRKRAR